MKKIEVGLALFRLLLDGGMIFLGLLLAFMVRMFGYDFFGFEAPETLIPFLIHTDFSWKITLFLILVLIVNGRYEFADRTKKIANFFDLFWVFSGGLALVLVFFFFYQTHFFSRLIFGLAWVFSFTLLLASDWTTSQIKKQLWKRDIGKTKVLILGSGKIADRIKQELKKSLEFDIKAQLKETEFSKLEDFLKKFNPDRIILATEKGNDITVGELAHIAHKNHTEFGFVPDELALDLATVNISSFGKMPIVDLYATKISGWPKVFKNIFDRVFAATSLVILSPVFATIGYLIWRSEKNSPIFYKSARIGKNGETFDCFKFRSMVVDAEKMKAKLLKKNERKGGVLFKMKDDPRITKIGKFLRAWSLDELPQLFNVLRGDMSLIGPRPHLPEEVKHYSEKQQYLLGILPGITGFAQINNMGDTKLSFEEEMRYELFYLKNWNFWLDMTILFKTIWILLQRKNY